MDTPDVQTTIERLSAMCDLIGLRTYVAEKTKYGKKPGPAPWTHTRAYLATYAKKSDPHEVIGLFESTGALNDIEAVRWLLKHDELVP